MRPLSRLALRGFCSLIGGVVLLIAGCSPINPSPVSSDAGNRNATRITSVKTVTVTPTPVRRTTTQPASVYAYHRAEIRANASGFVGEVLADIGDYVEAGQPLASIDVPELLKGREIIEARIRRFLAEEQRAKAGIDLADAEVQSAEALAAEATSQMAGVKAALAAADAELQRTQDLVGRGSLQNRVLDEAQLKRDSQSARKEAMASAIESARAGVAVAKARVASAQADSDAAKAETDIARRQLDEADVMIDYASVKAPFAGVITLRHVEPGEMVRQSNEVGNGQALFVVSRIDRVRVRIPVPENDAPSVNPGDEVTLTFPSFASEPPIVAKVTRRSVSLDPSTRTMMVEVELANDEGKLLPGMFGQASIVIGTKTQANMLPAQAIRFDETGNAYVYVVGQNDTVTRAEIETGIDDGNSIEVLAGIGPGQRIIGPHLKRFVDGQKVAVLTP